jgi:hypothetical protein
MADPLLKKMSELDELLEPAPADQLFINDDSEADPAKKTKRISYDSLSYSVMNDGRINGLIPPIITERQGGDTIDWSNGNAVLHNYVPDSHFLQCGIAQFVFVAQSSMFVVVTYPQPYGYKPLCLIGAPSLVSGSIPAGGLGVHTVEEAVDSIKIYITASGSITATLNIPWLVMGAVGMEPL